MKKFSLLIICISYWLLSFGQADQVTLKDWQTNLSFGLNYTQNKLTNPPVGYGVDQVGGNMMLNINANYQKGNVFWNNLLDFKFGLNRIGSGPIAPNSSKKIPFQKTTDFLKIASTYGYKFGENSIFSIAAGLDLTTQATPSYVDSEGQLQGTFLKDIRGTFANPIQSKFFSPATAVAYVGIGIQPSSKLFFSYSPLAYKGILVLDDDVARLVGAVDANGLPTSTVHGNKVEIQNGRPVFKNSYNQLGSYFLGTYKEEFRDGVFGVNSRLELYSNYRNMPEKVDVAWQTQVNLRIIKGLNLAYIFYLFYDYDILVAITDDSVVGGFSGLGRKVSTQRQFMLQYQINF